jgi:peptidyl-prolyl cis-trans isomerase D
MIRFLQQDNKLTKILFGVIIGAACISMVVYLIPGLMDNSGANDPTLFATVREPGALGRLFGATSTIKTQEVQQMAEQQMEQRGVPPQYQSMLMSQFVARAGEIVVQRKILEREADRLHLQVSDDDLRRELKDRYGQIFFPDGEFIGEEKYAALLTSHGVSIKDFEDSVKSGMELGRLQAMITGGISVPDSAVRQAYLVSGTKVKFDYAVISSEDLKKTINPPDVALQAFFQESKARYAQAVPEARKIAYIAFDASKVPGAKAPVTDADIQAYYAAHQAQYKSEEQVQTRHILITVAAGADAKTEAAAKAKAEDVLKQIKSGGNFAALASKYSEDPGSKDKGGELPLIPTSGLDPAYAKAAMALNPGQTSDLVRSQFGFHIIQTEKKVPAGVQPLAEVKDSIAQAVEGQKAGAAEQAFAQKLIAAATKDGIDKAAAANGLKAITTDYVERGGIVGGVSDSSGMLGQAFAGAKGAAPASVSTGDGFAVFQVVDIRPAHAPAFADWKAHVLEDFREQNAPQLLQAQLTKLGDEAKKLGDLKKAADELHVPLKSSELVGQDGQVPDLGPMSGPASVAFTLAKGAISGPINTGRDGVVLTVTDKQEPSAEDIAKNFAAVKEQLLGEQRDELFRVYLGTLTEKYEKGGAIKYARAPSKSAAPGIPGL